MYDNFRGWSDEEIYLREVNKSTLYDRLVRDRQKWKNGEIVMGHKYYQDLRLEFANPDAIDFRLEPTNSDDKQDDQLHASLTSLIKNKTHVNEFMDWAENMKTVNSFNFIGVYRQLIKMRPRRCSENTTESFAAMKIIMQLKLHETFPEHWAWSRCGCKLDAGSEDTLRLASSAGEVA